MSKVKWFSGGSERSNQAIDIINNLLGSESFNANNELQIILSKYKIELQEKKTSVPFILSRMNLDIAKALRNGESNLSEEQHKELKQLTSLSNIRYGY